MMFYKTVFVCSKDKKAFHIFYKYDKVGYVPTEVDFVYRSKKYSTVDAMNALAAMSRKDWKGKYYMPLCWYDPIKGTINKQEFVRFINLLKGESLNTV